MAPDLTYQHLCKYCSDAYSDDSGWGSLVVNEQTAAAARVGTHGDCAVVSFRGTMDAKDVLFDLMFGKTEFGRCKVHSGFLEQWQSLRQDIFRELESIEHSAVLLVGHSLGGALCCIAALDDQLIADKLFIATIGAPASGDAAAVEHVESRVTQHVRYQVATDVVPDLPFRFMGYMQSGVRRILDAGKVPFFFLAQWAVSHMIKTYETAGRHDAGRVFA